MQKAFENHPPKAALPDQTLYQIARDIGLIHSGFCLCYNQLTHKTGAWQRTEIASVKTPFPLTETSLPNYLPAFALQSACILPLYKLQELIRPMLRDMFS
ncbi:MAG: hypothetical protein EOM28_07230 [Clostridia bacterium]|nr:hypothetical protein [Clostridia bacterium]